jgi:hypothetical protein
MMDILNSDWLIKMLEKSSLKPQSRLLNLFDILEDWLDAPSIQLDSVSFSKSQTQSHTLQDFLALEAAKAGAEMPEVLASQLYFMVVAAAQEKLQSNNHVSFRHAKSAASALIVAQTKKEFHVKKSVAYAMAASFFAVVVGASTFFVMKTEHQQTEIALAKQDIPTEMPLETSSSIASPEQTAALVAQLEQMRHGNCQIIEAIQLPDNQKAIYINMFVNGRVSTDAKEQVIALDLIQRTRCNYTPMLMVNSKG